MLPNIRKLFFRAKKEEGVEGKDSEKFPSLPIPPTSKSRPSSYFRSRPCKPRRRRRREKRRRRREKTLCLLHGAHFQDGWALMAHLFKDGRGVGGVKRNQARKMLIFSAWMERNPKPSLMPLSCLPKVIVRDMMSFYVRTTGGGRGGGGGGGEAVNFPLFSQGYL